MKRLVSQCPVCQQSLKIAALQCPDCGLELRGRFDLNLFELLDDETFEAPLQETKKVTFVELQEDEILEEERQSHVTFTESSV